MFLVGPFLIIPEIEVSGIVGTGNHAVSTPDTSMMIHNNNAVIPFIGCLNGTNLGTGGIIAMIAEQDDRLSFGFRTIFLVQINLSDPVDIPAVIPEKGDIVFMPAGIQTCRASRAALIEINYHAPPASGRHKFGTGLAGFG
jgi:hypothetical protein